MPARPAPPGADEVDDEPLIAADDNGLERNSPEDPHVVAKDTPGMTMPQVSTSPAPIGARPIVWSGWALGLALSLMAWGLVLHWFGLF